MKLCVLDSNCSWIRSLVGALPADCRVSTYRIYSPQWLPNGIMDVSKVLCRKRISLALSETYIVVPGWNRFPALSSLITTTRLLPTLLSPLITPSFVFTFPFYSGVAALIRKFRPSARIAYHAHDPFEFYAYPSGYIRRHEDRMIPLCDNVFAISAPLADDFRQRYPDARVSRLGNATTAAFLDYSNTSMPAALVDIRKLGRVVGCVGQINSSYDWPLLEALAEAESSLQFVFVGNVFEEGEITKRIRLFFERPNVHWIGPVPHETLPVWMNGFDICLNPLTPNKHNDRRDTLRLYDYMTTARPIVSTDVSSARLHSPFVDIGRTFDDFRHLLSAAPPSPQELAERRTYIARNTWDFRAKELLNALSSN